MIELDGNYGEGGGALIRTALALSALTGQSFKVEKIRAGREKPGLKAQHLAAIKVLKEICQAKTSEVELGATEMWFEPGEVKKGIYNIDIGTAGSISLSLQALILPCLFAKGKVTLNIKGGTCGKWQASVYYLQNLLLPHLQRFVDKIELKVIKKGYYPKGGGEVKLEIYPRMKLETDFGAFNEELQAKCAKIDLLQQGELEQIRGIVNLSTELQEKEAGERIKKAAEGSLKEFAVPKNIRIEYSQTDSISGEVVLWALFSEKGKMDFDNPVILGGDALVEKGKSSEEVGKEAAENLKREIATGAAVDHYIEDQLIQFMGLLPGSEIAVSELSEHTKTNIYVVEKFLPVGFKISGKKISVERI